MNRELEEQARLLLVRKGLKIKEGPYHHLKVSKRKSVDSVHLFRIRTTLTPQLLESLAIKLHEKDTINRERSLRFVGILNEQGLLVDLKAIGSYERKKTGMQLLAPRVVRKIRQDRRRDRRRQCDGSNAKESVKTPADISAPG